MAEVDLQPPEDDGQSHQATAPLRAKPLFKIGKIGLEVVLITAGVFLGLLGEGWRENAEHRGLADASLRRFRSEFQANKAEVERVHGRHVQQLEALQKYFEMRAIDTKSQAHGSTRVFLNKHGESLSTRSVRRKLDKYLVDDEA